MSGVVINAVAVFAGCAIGLLFKKGIPDAIEKSINKMLGLGTGIFAINGILTAMITIVDGKLQSDGTIVLLISLVLGVIVGELLKIDDKFERLGRKVEQKFHAKDGLAKGFITSTLLFCVGAVTIMGSIDAGLGDNELLMVKSVMDFITAIILTSSLGIGVGFSAFSILVIQGAIALSAGLIQPVITDQLINLFCMVGYSVLLCMSLNLMEISKIKTANLLPALVIPILYYFLGVWFNFL